MPVMALTVLNVRSHYTGALPNTRECNACSHGAFGGRNQAVLLVYFVLELCTCLGINTIFPRGCMNRKDPEELAQDLWC